jgi:hypothetical protein
MVVVILARVRHELYRRHPAQGGACHWRKNRSTIKELRTARRGLLRPACLNPTDGIGRGEYDPAKFGSGSFVRVDLIDCCGLSRRSPFGLLGLLGEIFFGQLLSREHLRFDRTASQDYKIGFG